MTLEGSRENESRNHNLIGSSLVQVGFFKKNPIEKSAAVHKKYSNDDQLPNLKSSDESCFALS